MFPSRIAIALFVLAVVAGCSGANAVPGAFSPQGNAAQPNAATHSSRALSSASFRHPLGESIMAHLYVANSLNNSVTVYASNPDQIYTGLVRTIVSGLNTPKSLALDSSNNLYVSNISSDNVTEYVEAGPSPNAVATTIASGINDPVQVAVDPADNLWVVNAGGVGSVTEYMARTHARGQTIAQAINLPNAIAFSSSGNIVAIANDGNNTVTCYDTSSGNRLRTITAGISSPTAVLFDAFGDLYVANIGTNAITMYTPNSTSANLTISAHINGPVSLVIDNGAGYLWVANDTAGTLTAYDPLLGTLLDSHNDPFFTGVLAVANAPTGYNFIASVGSAWLTTVWVDGVSADAHRIGHPTSTFAPTQEGLKAPSGLAVGP
ncbi:MAG TPA: beta-propeller fold lactonase family protein [Candidatus Acidoferrales bacterium]|jgi:DNA-binding beta-propeller fold protein YncE|nr:beta-propeller fold lactonase family protein [Candidatus Acidoferrales bacterium]